MIPRAGTVAGAASVAKAGLSLVKGVSGWPRRRLRETEALAIIEKPVQVPIQAGHPLGQSGIARDLALDLLAPRGVEPPKGVFQKVVAVHGLTSSPPRWHAPPSSAVARWPRGVST